MIELGLLKHLKKKLRRRRRTLWVLGCMGCLLFVLTLGFTVDVAEAARINHSDEDRGIMERLEEMDGTLSVKEHIIYVCGKEERLLGRMDTKEIAVMLQQNPNWTARFTDDGRSLIYTREIADLSSHCKNHAYMGIDKSGNFSLFDGIPSNEKVLQTFFQIDMQYLESSLPKERVDELARGIRITDIDSYNSVLSTFSDYALDRNEDVIRSLPGASGREE